MICAVQPGKTVRRISPDAWAMLAIVATVLLAHIVYLLDFTDPNPLGTLSGLASTSAAGHLAGSPTIDPNVGYSSQALGHRAMLDLVHLSLPWWNPYQGTGTPLAGELQSGALFPPTLLLLMSNGQLYEHMLLEIVAGLSTYLLLRRLGLVRAASLAGGIAFALNGTFAWFAHATVNPVAFLPVILLGIEHAYDAAVGRRHGGWWLIAVGAALSVLAGFPEVSYIDGLLIVLWFAWRCGCAGRARVVALSLKAALGTLVAVLLSAPLLVAALPFLSHAYLGVHTGGLLGADRLGTPALPQLIMPYIYGPIFGFGDPGGQLPALWSSVGGYLTMSLLVFGVLGLGSRGHRGLRLILGLFSLLAFARMYDPIHVLGNVIGVLPGMANIAFYRYATSTLEFAVIVLAALGLNDLVQVPEHRRRLAWTTLGGLAVIGLGAVKAHSLTSQLGSHFASRHYFAIAVSWSVLALLALVLIAFRVTDSRYRSWLLGLVVTVDVLAMFAVPTLTAPAAVTIDPRPAAYLRSHLGTGRFFTLGPLAPNYGSYFGLASVNNNDFPPQAFATWVTRHLDRYVSPVVFVGNFGGGRNLFLPSPSTELLRNLARLQSRGRDLRPHPNHPGPRPEPRRFHAGRADAQHAHLSPGRSRPVLRGFGLHDARIRSPVGQRFVPRGGHPHPP